MSSRLEDCHNIEDLHRLGAAKTPRPIFDYAAGAADDEVTMARNTGAFGNYELVPRVLRNVEGIGLSTRVLGADLSMPLAFAPTGLTRLFHPGGEKAVARAAAKFGTAHTLSSVGTTTIEDFARAGEGPKWFQIYVWRDRGINSEFIARCKEAGYKGLMLTVDVPVAGNRERDLHNQFSLPPKMTGTLIASLLAHPGWTARFLTSGRPKLANVSVKAARKMNMSVAKYIDSQFDRTVTWDDAARMVAEWGGPFAVKGILSAEDAKRAVEAGASAVMVSNHGGRQLDTVPAPVSVLREIAEAVEGRAEVICDGGIRRGTDVLKALALGATACTTGRPYLYGLTAGGRKGVERALTILKTELERGMALLGARTVKDITPDMVRGIEYNKLSP